MNSPVYLWVILEEQRMARTDPRRHHSVAPRASRPVRRTPRFAVLRRRTTAAVALVRNRLAVAPAATQPVPGAEVARMPVGCAA